MNITHIVVLSFFCGAALDAADAPKPLRVFILTGQSFREGRAKVETFDYIGDDPATVALLKQMRNADGTPHVCDHVWISYLTGIGENNGEGVGKLRAGCGSRLNPAEDGGKTGPELTFGIAMDEALDGPLAAIQEKYEQVKQMAHLLKTKDKNHAN